MVTPLQRIDHAQRTIGHNNNNCRAHKRPATDGQIAMEWLLDYPGTTSSTASNGPCTLGCTTQRQSQCYSWSSHRTSEWGPCIIINDRSALGGIGGEATVTTSVISKTSHWPIIKTRDREERRKRRGLAWPFITMFGHNLSQIGFE